MPTWPTTRSAPGEPISGVKAYDIYMEEALPFVQQVGARVVFLGVAGYYLIGPTETRWDKVMLVHYPDVSDFLGMASNEGYQAILGHRMASLADSRLLPTVGV